MKWLTQREKGVAKFNLLVCIAAAHGLWILKNQTYVHTHTSQYTRVLNNILLN